MAMFIALVGRAGLHGLVAVAVMTDVKDEVVAVFADKLIVVLLQDGTTGITNPRHPSHTRIQT